MSNRTLSPVTALLVKARDFLSDQSNWCPEDGRNAGIRTTPEGKLQLCAARAVGKLYANSSTEHHADQELFPALDALDKAAVELFSRAITSTWPRPIIAANALGHAAVLQMFDRAIANQLPRSAPDARAN